MPRIERTADVTWEGNVARGAGTLSGETGAFSGLPYSLPTRIGQAEGKTSPEELLAAAHGGCITMSLASELTSNGTPPGRLDVTCRIVMDEVEGEGHQIIGSVVTIVGDLEGVDEGTFQELVAKADAGCPFTRLLQKAGVDVTVSARLGS
jgi:lipoyl-dependent peroxiredoxin